MLQLPAVRTLLVSALAVAGLGLVPAAASATDYAVSPTGTDGGACAQKIPCKTIGYALGKTADGDRVVLQSGTYNEQVTLPTGRSLVATAGTMPTVDGGGGTGILMTGERTRVRGLRVRGDSYAILLGPAADGATIANNVFDDVALNSAAKVALGGGSPAVTVTGNQFVASPAGGKSLGLFLNTMGAVDVADNTFTGFYQAVTVANYDGADASVRHNTVAGVHGDNGQGAGIAIYGDATVADNTLASVGGTGSTNPSYGIAFREDNTVGNEVPSVGISRRNHISGFGYSAILAAVTQADSSLTSEGDVITGNGDGISLYGKGTISGATIYDNTFDDIYPAGGAALTLRSSILEDGIAGASFPKPACTITASRGPATSGDDCQAFQTSADPGFVGSGDYHLTAGSPLLDAGDPVDPAPGEVDIDGDARAIAAGVATACAPRRDMGAYEFVPATPFDCPVAVTPPADQGTPGDVASAGDPVAPTDPTPPTTTTDQTLPPHIPLSPPAAGGGVVVLADEAKRLTVAIDGAKATTVAARGVSAVRSLPLGAHTVRVALPGAGAKKPVTVKVTLRDGQLAALVATVTHGRLAVRTVSIGRGARRLVSLLSGTQRVTLGTAKKATRLRHGAFATVPTTVTKLTVGARRLSLAKTAQLTVLAPRGRAVKAVSRHA